MTDHAIAAARFEQAYRNGELELVAAEPSADEKLLAELRELVLRLEGGDPRYLVGWLDLLEVHLAKSNGYGDAGDRMANYTGVSALTGEPRHRYPRRRIAEKLVRCENLDAAGREADLDEELLDVAGLALCALLMRRADGEPSS